MDFAQQVCSKYSYWLLTFWIPCIQQVLRFLPCCKIHNHFSHHLVEGIVYTCILTFDCHYLVKKKRFYSENGDLLGGGVSLYTVLVCAWDDCLEYSILVSAVLTHLWNSYLIRFKLDLVSFCSFWGNSWECVMIAVISTGACRMTEDPICMCIALNFVVRVLSLSL